MELNLLEKTELWIENLKLEHADLNRIAETVAAVLNFERGKVLVVDVRHNHITLDILEKTVDAADIFGKQKRLLESLAEIPGVLINEHTAIHSDGILGMIALDESEVEDTLSASEGLGERIKESMLSRAFVFPTGFEVKEGLIRDTNTPFLVEALKEKGFTVAFGEVLDDDRELIAGKLRRVADEGYGLILTTGGVGAESKDRTVEAVLSLDPKAAVPYIVKFKKGSGRHEKDGVRIAAGEYCGALLVTLPGPNDEVRLGFDALMKALQNGFDKQAVAEAVAQSIREKLRSNGEYHTTGVNQNERNTITTIAESLRTAKETRNPINTLTADYPEMTIEDAYKIQLQNIDYELKEGKRIVGKKIGLTSRGMQQLLGVGEPDYGFLLDDMLCDADLPISLSRMLQPKIEAEIAFVLKKPLSGPGVTVPQVLQATEGIMPAFELVDSRIADWKIKLPDTIADNASSALFVLGSTLTPLDGIDLRTLGMVFELNGVVKETGAGAEVLGNPAASVAWLANKLAVYGQELKAGEIILSGALKKAYEISREIFLLPPFTA